LIWYFCKKSAAKPLNQKIYCQQLLLILSIGIVLSYGCATRRAQPIVDSEHLTILRDSIHPVETQTEHHHSDPDPKEEDNRRHWIDSLYAQLNDTTRITQLFMPAVYADSTQPTEQWLLTLRHWQPGGVILMKSSLSKAHNVLYELQRQSRVPLLTSIDAEWGLSMRIDSTPVYPFQMTLGAINDLQLIEQMGRNIGEEMKEIGLNLSFSPVVDINNNPNNPVIGFRSFGSRAEEVSRRAEAYARGLQKSGVLACAKHFPGHGDTHTDSHHDLPQLTFNKERLDSLELIPFRRLIRSGLDAVMTAHLAMPGWTGDSVRPASLSRSIVHDALRKEEEFDKLIITDALNMKGVSVGWLPGRLEVEALKAGNDILLFTTDLQKAHDSIRAAIDRGELSMQEIEQKVKRILKAKYQVYPFSSKAEVKLQEISTQKETGGGSATKIESTEDHSIFSLERSTDLQQSVYRQAITLLHDPQGKIPISGAGTRGGLHIGIGTAQAVADIYKHIGVYALMPSVCIDPNAKNPMQFLSDSMIGQAQYALVSWHPGSQRPPYGISDTLINMLRNKLNSIPRIDVVCGNPYLIRRLLPAKETDVLMCAYEEKPLSRRAAVEALFGAQGVGGQLPVDISPEFRAGIGLKRTSNNSLGYENATDRGLTAAHISRIDSIIEQAITRGAMPGAQLMVAHRRKIIFNQSYGFTDTTKKTPVTTSTRYDLASLTKILATAPALMLLTDSQRIHPEATVAQYLPECKSHPIGQLRLTQIMTHQAGLKPYAEFWRQTFKNNQPDPYWYPPDDTPNVRRLPVSSRLSIRSEIRDSLWQWILKTPLEKPGQYVYSDFGPLILWKIIERVTSRPPNEFLRKHYYQPLGTVAFGFASDSSIPLSYIAPTEFDNTFRKELIRGTVHDPTAALMGGVSGHAGLFGNAPDVMRLLIPLNPPQHNKYIVHGATADRLSSNVSNSSPPIWSPSTLQLYTQSYYPGNRRGLMFDKPQSPPAPDGNTAPSASPSSFGHSGFTGTFCWVDPERDLIYVFLSNRVHPNAQPNTLARMGIRTQILEIFLQAIDAHSHERSDF
jgi:beta-glucosidase-like glycosyl hydrolase/CubicO group peptidase (beta-lactamase class C family)